IGALFMVFLVSRAPLVVEWLPLLPGSARHPAPRQPGTPILARHRACRFAPGLRAHVTIARLRAGAPAPACSRLVQSADELRQRVWPPARDEETAGLTYRDG